MNINDEKMTNLA
ncbi:conserved hypothetical protein, partial [Trichinella spiralis]